jgi:hypothetical protein
VISEAVRLEREKRKTLKQERRARYEDKLLDILTSPAVLRTALVAGIIAYSTHVCRSDHNEGPVQTALAFALPSVGIPLIAADAGITDKYALMALSAVGLGYVTGQGMLGLGSAGQGSDFWNVADTLAIVPRMMGIPIPPLD